MPIQSDLQPVFGSTGVMTTAVPAKVPSPPKNIPKFRPDLQQALDELDAERAATQQSGNISTRDSQ